MSDGYLTLNQLVTANSGMADTLLKLNSAVDAGQITPAQYSEYMQSFTGYKASPVYSKTGSTLGYKYTAINTASAGNAINSNAGTVARGTVNTPITSYIDTATGKVKSWKIIPPSAVGTRAYIMNSLATPLVAAGVGITLGKTIDSALYNAAPEFWDSRGMSSLNPDTWNSITTGLDTTDPITGVSASLFNLILGLDPDTGQAQAYIDQEALAYMAAYMNSQNAFAPEQTSGSYNPDTLPTHTFIQPLNHYYNPIPYSVNHATQLGTSSDYIYDYTAIVYDAPVYFFIYHTDTSTTDPSWRYEAVSTMPFTVDEVHQGTHISKEGVYDKNLNLYYASMGRTFYKRLNRYYYPSGISGPMGVIQAPADVRFLFANSVITTSGGVEGIGTQTGAQTPDVSTWGDYANVLPSLQQQYPDLWNNAITYPVLQSDGTVDERKYVPISLPMSYSDGQPSPYTQPISGGATQANPQIDPATDSRYADYVARLMQQPTSNPLDPNYTSPDNPTDTGEGSSPIAPVPTGSASALWSIYHPTQAQIDAFGAWLWSPSFIDQIAKIFNNPMESIIGLHKVYAQPVDAGTSTIAVGYLDSGVPSAYITQQYISVDCGQVDLLEQFGNVLDYTQTGVKLYLPFVGIVPLDVSEVMRSTIGISYEVDVLTGACLAVVTVSRDGNSAVLYQYAGNCAAQYPLSMGSYMGIVSGVISVAGSIAATVASGGSVAPLALGAAGAAMSSHTSVQNSGSFSGNAGVMGGKVPYLIIERTQSKIADNQPDYVGIPTNETKKVGDYTGYLKCNVAHIEGISATESELDMIAEYLSSGILI